MKKKPDINSTKLAGAGYLFFLREDPPAALDALRNYFLTAYEPTGPSEATAFDLRAPTSHTYLVKQASAELIDVHIQTLDNVYAVSLLWMAPEADSDKWLEKTVLEECQEALSEAGADILGSTLVVVAGPDSTPVISRLKESVAPIKDISAPLNGRVIHQLVTNRGRQYFVIEGDSTTSIHDFLAKELPRLAWSIQKLHREWAFFRDRIKTIMTEKERIDLELSRFFHQKVTGADIPDATQALDAQIHRLSGMYSVLATDLHLIKDAAGTLDKGLVDLDRQAEAFDDDGRGFPGYHVSLYREDLATLLKREDGLRQSLENTKAAIDVAQTQAELLRGSQSLALQEQTRELLDQNVILQDERISLQVAAQVIELVVIFYYTLKSWEAVAVTGEVEALPPVVKFGVVAVFSTSMVVLTHFIGTGLHKRRVLWLQTVATALLVVLSLGAMAVFPSLWSK